MHKNHQGNQIIGGFSFTTASEKKVPQYQLKEILLEILSTVVIVSWETSILYLRHKQIRGS